MKHCLWKLKAKLPINKNLKLWNTADAILGTKILIKIFVEFDPLQGKTDVKLQANGRIIIFLNCNFDCAQKIQSV